MYFYNIKLIYQYNYYSSYSICEWLSRSPENRGLVDTKESCGDEVVVAIEVAEVVQAAQVAQAVQVAQAKKIFQ